MTPLPDDLLEPLTRHVDLGHARRDGSSLRQMGLALGAPGAPLPQAASHGESSTADLMAF